MKLAIQKILNSMGGKLMRNLRGHKKCTDSNLKSNLVVTHDYENSVDEIYLYLQKNAIRLN